MDDMDVIDLRKPTDGRHIGDCIPHETLTQMTYTFYLLADSMIRDAQQINAPTKSR